MSSSTKARAGTLLVLVLGLGACSRGSAPAPAGMGAQSRPDRAAFDFEAALKRLTSDQEGMQRLAFAELRQNWASIRDDVARLGQRKEVAERAAGGYLLYKLADKSDAAAVRAYLRDPETEIRMLAVATVSRLHDGASVPALAENALTARYVECQTIMATMRELAPGAAERVCKELSRSDDWAKRRVAAQTLGTIEKLEDPEVLASLVDDEVWLVRLDAIGAAGSRRVAAARPRLVAGRHDVDPRMRAAIAQALGKLADPGDVAAVAEIAISDADADVRCEAAEALGGFGEEAALPSLEKILSFADEVRNVRRAAAGSVCSFRGERARRVLKALTKDSDSRIREDAAQALEAATQSAGSPPPAPTRAEGQPGR